jgi:hypothetical protein
MAIAGPAPHLSLVLALDNRDGRDNRGLQLLILEGASAAGQGTLRGIGYCHYGIINTVETRDTVAGPLK